MHSSSGPGTLVLDTRRTMDWYRKNDIDRAVIGKT